MTEVKVVGNATGKQAKINDGILFNLPKNGEAVRFIYGQMDVQITKDKYTYHFLINWKSEKTVGIKSMLGRLACIMGLNNPIEVL